MPTPLPDDQIQAVLNSLPGWEYAEGKLTKTYRLGDFREALTVIVRIGLEAEAMNHHPELLNVYSLVTVSLWTHDAGNKVTQKDVDLATAIQRAVG